MPKQTDLPQIFPITVYVVPGGALPPECFLLRPSPPSQLFPPEAGRSPPADPAASARPVRPARSAPGSCSAKIRIFPKRRHQLQVIGQVPAASRAQERQRLGLGQLIVAYGTVFHGICGLLLRPLQRRSTPMDDFGRKQLPPGALSGPSSKGTPALQLLFGFCTRKRHAGSAPGTCRSMPAMYS